MPKHSITLEDGTEIPAIAFGTGTRFLGKDCTVNVLQALQHGFRHIDAAEMYDNEQCIGEALQQWSGSREDVFITTKWGSEGDGVTGEAAIHPRDALMRSLAKLRVDYVDMYLLHGPYVSPARSHRLTAQYTGSYTLEEAWKIFESLKSEGLCKNIGISKCRKEHVERLSRIATIKPAVNQIKHHPYLAHNPDQIETLQFCKNVGIPVWAYGTCFPLKGAAPVDNPAREVIERIAEERDLTPAKVCLIWAARTTSGLAVSTTTKESRLDEILAVFDAGSYLDEADINKITEAGRITPHLVLDK